MSHDTYTLLIRGFDVVIEPSEESDAYHVTVSESGSLGWEIDIPVDLEKITQSGMEDAEDLDGSDALMQYVGNAAVDLFEAQRGTLGEGATAPEVQAMKKRSYYDSLHWEEWFMKLKGTPFEEQAAQMLEQYFQLSMECVEADDDREDLWRAERKILHDLNMLNLERMKALPAGQTVIIIQGSRPKMACWDADQLEDYLSCFIGDPLEPQAIAKVRELLDIRDQINNAEVGNDIWKQQKDLENQMFDLSLQALQQNVRVPETGMEAAPNMANDLAELMEGVDLHAPLEPFPEDVIASRSKKLAWFFENWKQHLTKANLVEKLAERGWGDWLAKSAVERYFSGDTLDEQVTAAIEDALTEMEKAARRIAFEETEPVEDRIEELGEKREGLDPAEMEGEQFSFNTNDYVELKQEITISGPGWGGKTTYPKGTRGYAETLWDKNGNYYLMRTEDGRHLIKVRWDQIKAVPRR